MQSLIIYDTLYGNTAKIAEAVAEGMKQHFKVSTKPVKDAKLADLSSTNLIVVGSPTQGGQPTKAIQAYLRSIPDNGLKSIDVAAFDTRVNILEQALPLRMLMKRIGFAAPKIARQLEEKGGHLVQEPGDFLVSGKEGPIRNGELDHAKSWAESLAAATSREF